MAGKYATGSLLGAKVTGQDIGVTADNGTVIFPHAVNTQVLIHDGIAVYGITVASITASSSVTIGVSGTVSAGGTTYVSMNSAIAPANVGIWVRTSAAFPV